MALVRPGSPTLKRLRQDPRGNRWDDENQCMRKPMELIDLPEEIVGLIAQHMVYPVLLVWMATCKTMNRHCWNTWRGQALLLTKLQFGTQTNFEAIFNKWVTRRMWEPPVPGTDWLDAGVHIVHRYLEPRKHQPANDEAWDRTERAIQVMKHATKVYADEYNGALGDPFVNRIAVHKQLMKKLSAVHMDLQVQFLLPRTGLNFKKVLERTIVHQRVHWAHKSVAYSKHPYFLDGVWDHEDDDEPPGTEPEQVDANLDPQLVQAQVAQIFNGA